ncbi:hypothetical protein B0H13DRAFT_2546760 [Mycena leptocephala]|nr:hypothetical protein B0H13DRAFT_2546760 [Mycena leptocephala]
MRPQDWAEERLERRQFLRPLSQTCSTLRAVFLPLLWRHFEACDAHLHIRYKRIGISVQTGIFPHIRFFHISLTSPSAYILARLFDFLQDLPNLECLQLYSVDYYLVKTLAGAFNDHPLPTVTTLCIPGWATTLFPAFPNVQSLTFSTHAHHDTLRLTKRSFPQLHSLGGVYLTSDSIVELHGFPHLRSLYLSGPIDETSASLLSRLPALPFLSSLSLENRTTSSTGELLPLEALIAAGTNVLHVARGRGRKVLTVWIFKGHTEFELDPVVIYVKDE